MDVQSLHECASAPFHKGIGKVKCSKNANTGKTQGQEAPGRTSDSVHTSPVARVMSREFGRVRDGAPAAPERLASLVAKFGGDSPAAFADADIDAVLQGMLQRA